MQYRTRKQFGAIKVFDGENCVAAFHAGDDGESAHGVFLRGCSAAKISVFDEDRNQFVVGTVGEMMHMVREFEGGRFVVETPEGRFGTPHPDRASAEREARARSKG